MCGGSDYRAVNYFPEGIRRDQTYELDDIQELYLLSANIKSEDILQQACRHNTGNAMQREMSFCLAGW